MTSSTFKLPQRMYDDIISHAERDAPLECVGVIACRSSDEVAVVRMEAQNRSPTPRSHFYVEPFEQFTIEAALEEQGLNISAVYHSHVTSQAYPSGADRLFAGKRLMVICSLDTQPPHLRVWQIGTPEEEPQEVEVEVLSSMPDKPSNPADLVPPEFQ